LLLAPNNRLVNLYLYKDISLGKPYIAIAFHTRRRFVRNATTCNLEHKYRRFRGICYLHILERPKSLELKHQMLY